MVEAQFGLCVQGEVISMSGRSRWNYSVESACVNSVNPFSKPPPNCARVDCIALTHKVGRGYRSKKNIYLFAEASGRYLLLRA